MIITRNKNVLSLLASIVLLSSTLCAKNNENIVDSIMKLRGDVEALYSKIDENKEQYKSQMKSLAMQRADNEAQINRKETALQLSLSEVERLKENISSISTKNESLKPMLMVALERLRTMIKEGIPFKTEERLSEVEKIKTQLNDAVITQEKALSLVWALYDDTLRLTKEIGLFKQEIEVEGERKMAQIAKLGSVMLFFATPDDKVGYMEKKEGQYHTKIITDEANKAEIVALFDALQKQIRTGYFTLPNALVLMEK